MSPRLAILLALSVATTLPSQTIRTAGQLVDELGEPVAHGEVWIGPFDDGDARLTETRSDGLGFFSLAIERPERPVYVYATAEGRVRVSGYQPSNAGLGRYQQLRLGEASEIRGTVRDAEGSPCGGASLSLHHEAAYGDFQTMAAATSDEAGAFCLAKAPLGWITVCAWHPERGWAQQRVLATPGGVQDVTLDLGPTDSAATLRLSRPAPGVYYSMHRWEERRAMPSPLPPALLRIGFDGEGVLRLPCLPPGKYQIQLRGLDGVRATPSAHSFVHGPSVRLDSTIEPAPDVDLVLEGRIIDLEDRPVPGLEIAHRGRGGPGRECQANGVTGLKQVGH